VGVAYKQLITDWGDVLPTQSMCLTVPVVMPNEAEGEYAKIQKERARAMSRRPAAAVAAARANGAA
jgi:hypothetical protein